MINATHNAAPGRAAAPQRLVDVISVSASAVRALTGEEQTLLHKLTPELAQYMAHPSFTRRGVEKELYGTTARLAGSKATVFIDHESFIPSHVRGNSNLPTLSAADEQHLFRQYNYARYRAAGIVEEFAGRALPVSRVRRLLAWSRIALAARAQIVHLNMPLVLAMAKRTRLGGVDFSELISEGNMALLRSVDKFDCSRGFKFSTYGCRAILKSFSRVAMRASRYNGLFPVEFDPSLEKSDYVEQQREGMAEKCADELRLILEGNLAGLSGVEERVIRERFAMTRGAGKDEPSPKTLEQVGVLIGVTKERVRQIQNKALQKLKEVLEEDILAA